MICDPKRREIRAAPFRDRVLHHAIVAAVAPIFERGFIADTYACIRGRGQNRAVERYRRFARSRQGRGYALHCDIASYFRNVDHEVLLLLLRRRIGDRRLLDLLASLIAHGQEAPGLGMPIGSLTSQMFANLYLDPLDHFVKETLRVRHYLRYMDDLVILLYDRAEARRRLAEVEAFLAERLRLRLNPRRSQVAPLRAPRDFLGYVHHPDGPTRVRRRNVGRLRRRLAALDEGLEAGTTDWLAAQLARELDRPRRPRRRLPTLAGDLRGARPRQPGQTAAGGEPRAASFGPVMQRAVAECCARQRLLELGQMVAVRFHPKGYPGHGPPLVCLPHRCSLPRQRS
ncbi:MAG: RNA-directed DNA polymerase [Solirubrobacterales bacterium]